MSPLRIEFHHPVETPSPEPPQPGAKPPPPPPPAPAVATVEWRRGQSVVEADDEELAAKLRRAFRLTPVVTDDPSLRSAGTRGVSVLAPGDLDWCRAVALVRVPAEVGLVPRFVSGPQVGGFDPAANYRRFRDQVERLDARAVERGAG
ncbi:MAG TPA: hypothetical protein VF108_01560 [Actinomycetota bacterium]